MDAVQVRRATASERLEAVARLVRGWGDPVIARAQRHSIADRENFVAGDMGGLAAVSLRHPPIAALTR